MTLERLKQYRDQKQELKHLKAEIARADLIAQRATRVTADTVRASMPEYPFTEHTVVIRGADAKYVETQRRRIALMEHRRVKLAAECLEIETWIASLTDSKLRQIVELRFVKGYEWGKVAKSVYGISGYADAARKLVTRYFEKVS